MIMYYALKHSLWILWRFTWNHINFQFVFLQAPSQRSQSSFSVTICHDKTRQRSWNEKEILSQVNISGLRAATDETREKGRRIIWIFLLTVCFAVMVAQITDRVRHFLSEPVAVQVTVARNHSLLYPAITICNKVCRYTPHTRPKTWEIVHERHIEILSL